MNTIYQGHDANHGDDGSRHGAAAAQEGERGGAVEALIPDDGQPPTGVQRWADERIRDLCADIPGAAQIAAPSPTDDEERAEPIPLARLQEANPARWGSPTPPTDDAVRAAKADAWDEGYNALRDMAAPYDEQRGFLNSVIPVNPYREVRP